MAPSEPITALMAGIAALYRSKADGPGRAGLLRAARAIEAAPAITSLPPPVHLPVAAAVAGLDIGASGGAFGALALAFAAYSPSASWEQNPNYVARPPSPGFLDRYGYVELVGPARVIPSDQFRVGFLLLGPDTLYPAHHHPAEEVYHVVAGAADWWRKGEDWVSHPIGTAIHHPSGLPHATRTGPKPLLALYCWTGAIATHARLV